VVLLIAFNTSLVAVCCSSDSRKVTGPLLYFLFEARVGILQALSHTIELLPKRFQFVPCFYLMRWSSSPAPIRAAPERRT